MAILDDIFVRVQPVAGESTVNNIVTSSAFTGSGTPTLLDDTGLYFWRVAAGTLLKTAASYTMNASTGGITICLRFRRRANGTDDFLPLVGWLPSAGVVTNCPVISANGASSYRGRLNNGSQGATTTSSKATNVIHTLVWRFETSATAASDFGKLWFNQVGRVGTAPDVTSAGANATTTSFVEAFVNCQASAEFDLFDFMIWGASKTEAECAGLADDVRALIPAPGGGDTDAPTFTVAPAVSTIGQTSATVTATINETGSIFWVAVPQGDATPSVAQVIAGQNAAGGAPVDWGSAVGTTTLSESAVGLTAGTPYKFCVVARDDEPTPNVQASVTVVNFTTAAAGDTTPPTFTVAPAVTSITQTGANIGAEINETGSIFYVVVPNAEGTPSVTQVIAGQNAAGGAPSDSGSDVGTTVLSDTIAGLTASTAYKACVVARDDEGTPNVQASVTVVGFTTLANPSFTLTDLANNADDPWASTSSITVDVYNPSTGALVVRKAGLTSSAGADVVVSDAALVAATTYNVFITIGTAIGAVKATAA